jgi:small-conductance mechanosensitive channel
MSFQPVIDNLIKTFLELLNFIPRLINGLIILIIGYIISWIVHWLVRFVLRHVGLQQLADRTGFSHAISRLRVRTALPDIIAEVIFFFLFLSFAASAFRLMEFTAVADLLDTVLRFVPRAISAALLILFGSMLARFLGDTIVAVAESVNITYGRALGRIIEYAIVAFVVVLAISTLGVDTTILTTSLTIIVAAVGLAIALTFAWGAHESARNVIAGFYVRQSFRPGQQLTFGDYSGRVRSTSGAYTILDVIGEGGQVRTISLPNSLLLQGAVGGQEGGPETSASNEQGPTGSDQEGS